MELQDELQKWQIIESKFNRLESSIDKSQDRLGLQDHECYENLVNTYIESCGYDEYSLKYFNILAELCNSESGSSNGERMIKDMCPSRE